MQVKTSQEIFEELMMVERWKGQDAQRVYDERVVEWAMLNGKNPLTVMRGPAFAIPSVELVKLREGLEL